MKKYKITELRGKVQVINFSDKEHLLLMAGSSKEVTFKKSLPDSLVVARDLGLVRVKEIEEVKEVVEKGVPKKTTQTKETKKDGGKADV